MTIVESTTTAGHEVSIEFERLTRDYHVEVDGEYLGTKRTEVEARQLAADYVRQQLALDARSADRSIVTDEHPYGSPVTATTVEVDIPGLYSQLVTVMASTRVELYEQPASRYGGHNRHSYGLLVDGTQYHELILAAHVQPDSPALCQQALALVQAAIAALQTATCPACEGAGCSECNGTPLTDEERERAEHEMWQILDREAPHPLDDPAYGQPLTPQAQQIQLCTECGHKRAVILVSDGRNLCEDCYMLEPNPKRQTSTQLCTTIYELALVDAPALIELLRSIPSERRQRLAWHYTLLLQTKGLRYDPAFIVRNWNALVEYMPWEPGPHGLAREIGRAA